MHLQIAAQIEWPRRFSRQQLPRLCEGNKIPADGGRFVVLLGRLVQPALNLSLDEGAIARSSVSDRFCATTSVTSFGHRKAARAARRNARERMPLSDSASRASSSATSVFDSTFENRFRLELYGASEQPSSHIALWLHPFLGRMRF
ncbi:MAG: hypothetical protein DMF37_07885 [Verrucomicrobia bacterium]|nr:MAG: hypothetical protein DMF37_07885 [Verrucomicrobiota bacterium]